MSLPPTLLLPLVLAAASAFTWANAADAAMSASAAAGPRGLTSVDHPPLNDQDLRARLIPTAKDLEQGPLDAQELANLERDRRAVDELEAGREALAYQLIPGLRLRQTAWVRTSSR